MSIKPISISIVSHNQFKLMEPLLNQLFNFSESIYQVIITINVPEEIPQRKQYKSNFFIWIFNKKPLGFGRNHNNASKKCVTDYFCIMNPDILIEKDTLLKLLFAKQKYNVGIIGPSLIDANNIKQVNARKFPKFISSIINFNRKKQEYFYCSIGKLGFTDWIGGMFMLIKISDFNFLGGFDEKFFLYYEDVDICYRARKQSLKIAEFRAVTVTHNAQRSSHKQLIFFLMHLKSFLKFFLIKNRTS
jgi:N-acetylglucosaminyl-diphospho-decaprenol L-rhamnosyltransferase